MWTFVRLKVALLRGSLRRARRNPWTIVGTIAAILMATIAAIGGLVVCVTMRAGWSEVTAHRFLVVFCAMVVFGWWFGPLLSGGADETVDPQRLALLPLTRNQLRRGQIAAGLVGPAPLMVVVWSIGLVIGTAGPVRTWPFTVAAAVVLVMTALMGSRAIATTLAVLNRSRRGGDIATFIAVVGASMLFAASQLLQFISEETLDGAVRILRWTPLGAIGEAFERFGDGDVPGGLWRMAYTGVLALAGGWLWSRQLDRLLTDADERGRVEATVEAGALPIFDGVRSRLPRTPIGAAIAKEIVYLRRSPGRRASFLTNLLLGFVYVAIIAARGDIGNPTSVLLAPIAMVFAVQLSSNQCGIDPAAFWVEVVAGPPQIARWAGRQLVSLLWVAFPVAASGLLLAIVSGGWAEFGIMALTMVGASFALVGMGSAMSPAFAQPLPDSGNPFGNRQAMQGTGCVAGVVGLLFLVFGALVVAGPELGLLWAASEGHTGWFVVILLAGWSVHALVWWVGSRFALAQLEEKELVVLERLDARLNA